MDAPSHQAGRQVCLLRTWKATLVGWGRLGGMRRFRFMFNDDLPRPFLLRLRLLELRCCESVACPAAASACRCGSSVGPPPPTRKAPARVGWSRTRSHRQAQRQARRTATRADARGRASICVKAQALPYLLAVVCDVRSLQPGADMPVLHQENQGEPPRKERGRGEGR